MGRTWKDVARVSAAVVTQIGKDFGEVTADYNTKMAHTEVFPLMVQICLFMKSCPHDLGKGCAIKLHPTKKIGGKRQVNPIIWMVQCIKK